MWTGTELIILPASHSAYIPGVSENISNWLCSSSRKVCLVLHQWKKTRLCTAQGWRTVSAAPAREVFQVSFGGLILLGHWRPEGTTSRQVNRRVDGFTLSTVSGGKLDEPDVRITPSAFWAINMGASHEWWTLPRLPESGSLPAVESRPLPKWLKFTVPNRYSTTNFSDFHTTSALQHNMFSVTNGSVWSIHISHDVIFFFHLEQLAAL